MAIKANGKGRLAVRANEKVRLAYAVEKSHTIISLVTLTQNTSAFSVKLYGSLRSPRDFSEMLELHLGIVS